MRAALLLLAALAAAPLLAAPASAHMGTVPPTGTLTVPAHGKATIGVQLFNVGDTIEWITTVPAETGKNVSSHLVWTDTGGATHAVQQDAPVYGSFQAPKDLVDSGSTLVYENSGDRDVQVQWTYQTSVDFWTSPAQFLPALIPLFLLIGALYAGKRVDQRAKAKRAELLAVRQARAAARRAEGGSSATATATMQTTTMTPQERA